MPRYLLRGKPLTLLHHALQCRMLQAAPDETATGLLEGAPDPFRYDGVGSYQAEDRCEVPAIVASWLPRSSRILDVGCGSGAMTALVCSDPSNTVVGVEPDPIRSASARAKGLNVFTGLLDEEFLKTYGPFDVIMFLDVLEHMAAPADILAIARKGLAPGGCIIASVPNVAHWTVRGKLLLGRFDYTDSGIMDATHLRWFTRKSYRELFNRSGFAVADFSGSAGGWLGAYRRIPAGARRWLIPQLVRLFPGLFSCQHIIKAHPN